MKKGFTLIELLVVIGIIGIMATFVSGNFLTSIKRGRDAKRKADVRAIKNAFEQCFSLTSPNAYPAATNPLTGTIVCGTTNLTIPTSGANPNTYYSTATTVCSSGMEAEALANFCLSLEQI